MFLLSEYVTNRNVSLASVSLTTVGLYKTIIRFIVYILYILNDNY